jgi:putative heme transporter
MGRTLRQRRHGRHRPPLSRPVRRTLQLLVVLAIFNYLVLPQLSGVDFDLLLRVDWWLVALAAGLQIGKLVAYTIMTKAVVPMGATPDFWTLFRIQLSAFAVSHVVPGGTAAGGVLAYRLLTTAGMRGTDAAFAMATQGAGSAVLLNVILWLALVAAIPARGLHPMFVPAALVGVLLIGGFTAAVLLLVRGEDGVARVVRRVAERVPLLDPDRVEQVLRGVAARLQVLAEDRRLVVRATLWGSASWLLDAASLWVFVGAFGHWVRVDGLLIAFGLANVLAAVPVTPSGLGLVEGVLIPTLAGFGAPGHAAALGVLAYRLVNFWLPIPFGGLAYLALEVERGIAERRGEELRQLAEESFARADTTREWAERHGVRLHRPAATRTPPRDPSEEGGSDASAAS